LVNKTKIQKDTPTTNML